MRTPYTWKLPRVSFELGERTLIMGILNVTPDSFSDHGFYSEPSLAIERGQEIEAQGADILDIGGESTRPGSEPVSVDEEIRRVIPVVAQLARVLRIPISIDTYRAEVARRAIDAGAQVINDVGGLRLDPEMGRLAAETGTGVVLMHSRGDRSELHMRDGAPSPETVCGELSQTIEKAIQSGIERASIVADPGLGFSKSSRASLKILKSLGLFSTLGYPLLVGVSRKSFIKMDISGPEVAVWTTAAAVALAVGKGAHAIRVHDVAQMRAVAQMTDAIEQEDRGRRPNSRHS